MKDKRLTVARVIMTVLTVAAIAAIFYNSSLNADESTEQSSPLTDLINGWLRSAGISFTLTEGIVRKLAHFTEYSVLGALMLTTVYLYTGRRGKTLCIATPAGILVSVCDELIQLIPEGRSSEVRDVLIDSGGVLFAAIIVMIIISLLENRRKVKQ